MELCRGWYRITSSNGVSDGGKSLPKENDNLGDFGRICKFPGWKEEDRLAKKWEEFMQRPRSRVIAWNKMFSVNWFKTCAFMWGKEESDRRWNWQDRRPSDQQHLSCVDERLNFILNVLGGDKDIQQRHSQDWGRHVCISPAAPHVYHWLIGTLAVLVVQWSEKYTGYKIIIFEEQQVWGEVRDKECSWILGSMRCPVGKDS